MEASERQFLLTAAWMFMRHGQNDRAKPLVEALCEDNPRDGIAAAAFAELLLEDGEASRALDVLRMADFPTELSHAEAVLESRALHASGRPKEAANRWRRFVESRKGGDRKWIA